MNIIIKYNQDVISGTLFNLYELGLFLESKGLNNIFWFEDNCKSIDISQRYTKSLKIWKVDKKISKEDYIIHPGFDIFFDKRFDIVNRYFILVSWNFQKTLPKALRLLSVDEFTKRLKKVSILYNPMIGADLVNRFDMIEYHHGFLKDFYDFSKNNENSEKWCTLLSSYNYELANDMFYVSDKNAYDIINKKYRPDLLDDIKSFTPFFDYKGYLYIKKEDFFPKTPNEFLCLDKPVILCSISDGIKRMYKLDKNSLWKDLRELKVKRYYLEFDYDSFINRL